MTLIAQSLSFDREFVTLFENVSFQIKAGEWMQVRGPNGSGKTTLLRILAGLLEPTEGKIKRDTSFIYLAHNNGLKSHLTVLENIKLMSALFDTKITMTQIAHVLTQLQLSKYLNHYVKHLSAGEQRRVSYARLLLFPKKCWLLDEPTTSIDQQGQIIFADMLQQHLNHGGSAVVATHQDILVEHANHILQLESVHA